MTWTAVTDTKLGVSVWSWKDEVGVRHTQLSIGSTAFVHLTDEQRRELVEYLAQ